MENKETFIIRTDNFQFIEDLSYEERGRLFTIIFLHSIPMPRRTVAQQQEYETLCDNRYLMKDFKPFKKILEEDDERYAKIVARNRANGSKGGRPRKNPENPVGYLETQKTSIPNPVPIPNPFADTSVSSRNRVTPTLEDVLRYANEHEISEDLATRFFWNYERIGWTINGQPIASWTAALMTWKLTEKKNNHANNGNTNNGINESRRNDIAKLTIDAVQSSSRGIQKDIDDSVL